MSSAYGENLKLTIFGQSHGSAIGMTLDNIPAGLPVDMDALNTFLKRRAPGNTPWSTPRKEADSPEFLSGLVDGRTCGAPLAAIIRNTNTKSDDYRELSDLPRPGHADYAAQMKYKGFQDTAGGGHFSGRLTAPLCIAGGLCKQWLEVDGIQIGAHILQLYDTEDATFDPLAPELARIGQSFPVLNDHIIQPMRDTIAQAHRRGDSVGGIIECAVTGLPAGLGGPLFGGIESRLSAILYGIPAVKSVEFGSGSRCAAMLGSENNDAFVVSNGKITTQTNHCGGILGGITNGMPVLLRCAVKPTPSIAQPQKTVRLSTMEPSELQIVGRHDPCIVPRAVPVVEAAVAIAIFDICLGR